jgi:hypothetical protein
MESIKRNSSQYGKALVVSDMAVQEPESAVFADIPASEISTKTRN